jgi:hypothetical protein
MGNQAQHDAAFDKLRNELQKSVLLQEAARLNDAELRANIRLLKRNYNKAKRIRAKLRSYGRSTR